MKYSEIINAVTKNPKAEVPFRDFNELLEILSIDPGALSSKNTYEIIKLIKCFKLLDYSTYVILFNFNKVIFVPVAICEGYNNIKFLDVILYRKLQNHILEIINSDIDKLCVSQTKLDKNVCIYQKSNIDRWKLNFLLEDHKHFYYKKGKRHLLIKDIAYAQSSNCPNTYSITLKDSESQLVIEGKDIYVKYNIGE